MEPRSEEAFALRAFAAPVGADGWGWPVALGLGLGAWSYPILLVVLLGSLHRVGWLSVGKHLLFLLNRVLAGSVLAGLAAVCGAMQMTCGA